MKLSRGQLADWYNARVADDPTNAPTRREVAEAAGISVSAAHAWLEQLEAEGVLRYPIRRRPIKGDS